MGVPICIVADNLAKRMLDRLQREHDKGLIIDTNLLKSISKIEDTLKFGLRKNRLRLQSTDPHYKK